MLFLIEGKPSGSLCVVDDLTEFRMVDEGRIAVYAADRSVSLSGHPSSDSAEVLSLRLRPPTSAGRFLGRVAARHEVDAGDGQRARTRIADVEKVDTQERSGDGVPRIRRGR